MNVATQDSVAEMAITTVNISQPLTVEASGLTQSLLEDIVCRQMHDSGVIDISDLCRLTALSTRLVEEILNILRQDARVEVRQPVRDSSLLRYSLTEHGRMFAISAFGRSGYVGPAPISASDYINLINNQSVHEHHVTRRSMQKAYEGVVIDLQLLDRLGSAFHSGKAIFIYGPAGTGKTYICKRLNRLFNTPIYIPSAVVVGDSIIRIFDPAIHKKIKAEPPDSAYLAARTDPRVHLCERPFITSGGELTSDLLEVQYDASTNQYLAPLQLKATHGIYMIDDLGRQKMSVDELFNRWIVPMESKEDFLNLHSGQRLNVPFDVILIFSTNMVPEDLDDPAFHRRIGHKIGFEYSSIRQYSEIWKQECDRRGIECDSEVVEYVFHELHEKNGIKASACHPKDLIGIAMDYIKYSGESTQITIDAVDLAWQNYFAVSATDRDLF